MEINWFTVIAQIVNFLVLVWLLKRFLYKPVLNAIREREKKIESQLDDAAALKTDAKKEQEKFQQKNEDFDKERSAKMNKVQDEVSIEKQRLLEEVRKESTVLRSKYDDSLQQHEQEIADTIKRKTKDEVFAIAGKMLADLSNESLEEQIINVFIKKIKNLDNGNKAKLKNALNNSPAPSILKSAFELSDISKQKLETAIDKVTKQQNNFQYRLKPEMVGGIEIETKNYQLSWNIQSYLDSLKNNSIIKNKENAID